MNRKSKNGVTMIILIITLVLVSMLAGISIVTFKDLDKERKYIDKKSEVLEKKVKESETEMANLEQKIKN